MGEAVADWLAHEIAVGRLKPGTRITTAWVCDQLGVSTTPVREAFRSLDAEGLVSVESHRGVWVADIPVSEIPDLYELRAYIQGLATRQCAERATDSELCRLQDILGSMRQAAERRDKVAYWTSTVELRESIMMFARNKMLAEVGNRLERRVRQLGFIAIGVPGRMDKSSEYHAEVVRHVAQREGDLAESTMRHLIRTSAKELEQALDRR